MHQHPNTPNLPADASTDALHVEGPEQPSAQPNIPIAHLVHDVREDLQEALPVEIDDDSALLPNADLLKPMVVRVGGEELGFVDFNERTRQTVGIPIPLNFAERDELEEILKNEENPRALKPVQTALERLRHEDLEDTMLRRRMRQEYVERKSGGQSTDTAA